MQNIIEVERALVEKPLRFAATHSELLGSSGAGHRLQRRICGHLQKMAGRYY